MEDKIINTNIICVVKEENNKVEYSEIAIPRHTEFLDELRDMVNNPNRTLMDLQNHFELHFKGSPKYINYCVYYSDSYVVLEKRPESINFEKYKRELTDAETKAKSNYQNHKYDISLEAYVKHAIERHKEKLKETYFNDCKYYIRAFDYTEAYSRLMSRPEIKMASSSSIGWYTHDYKITEEVSASVYSNFAYGSAATFALTLLYKDIKIVPYSYWTEYAYAKMDDLRRYTRLYYPSSENWVPCLQTTAEAAQIAKSGANQFYDKFIVNEIEEMMSGLRRINSSTDTELKKWVETRHENNKYIFVRDFTGQEKSYYSMYPEEFIFGLKIEKLSGALHFMEDLKSIEEYYEKVEKYIQEIKSINTRLIPDIDSFLIRIEHDIKIITKEIETLVKKLNEIEDSIAKINKQLEPYEDILSKRIEEKLSTKDETTKEYTIRESEKKQFSLEYPEFELLHVKIVTLNEKLSSVYNEKFQRDRDLHYRENLVKKLECCKSDIIQLAK